MTDQTDLLAYNARVIADFRASGRRAEDRPLMLLTTTGARSGQPRTSPLMYATLGGRMAIIASHNGAEHHPQWYRNLAADPSVTVEVDGEAWSGTARTLTGDERAEAWADLVAQHPFFTDHQANTEREIPVVVLTRATD